jgi:glycosyltransferase involved in cell wall biosynthesis
LRSLLVKDDRMQALALVESPGHVCCRYRIRAFESACWAAGIHLSIQGLERRPLTRLRQFRATNAFDVVILQRKLLPLHEFQWLRHNARGLVFDFDDAVLYRDSYDPRGSRSRRRESRFSRVVRGADVVLAGNPFLADCAFRAGSDPRRTQIVPTCVEPRHYPLRGTEPRQGPVTLVWIGSSSTLQGLEQVPELWRQLTARVPNIRFRLISDRFPDWPGVPLECRPWSEAGEAEALATADIGISRVPDDLWSRGKCGLKLLQYQAAGLPVVTNPVGVHAAIIRPGLDGFLAETVDEWVDAIGQLAASADLRMSMGQQARRHVEAAYSVDAWAPTFVRALHEAARGISTRIVPGPPASSGAGPRRIAS